MSRDYTPTMKEPEYTEGPKATEDFERTMTALFRAPKEGKPDKKQSKATSWHCWVALGVVTRAVDVISSDRQS